MSDVNQGVIHAAACHMLKTIKKENASSSQEGGSAQKRRAPATATIPVPKRCKTIDLRQVDPKIYIAGESTDTNISAAFSTKDQWSVFMSVPRTKNSWYIVISSDPNPKASRRNLTLKDP